MIITATNNVYICTLVPKMKERSYLYGEREREREYSFCVPFMRLFFRSCLFVCSCVRTRSHSWSRYFAQDFVALLKFTFAFVRITGFKHDYDGIIFLVIGTAPNNNSVFVERDENVYRVLYSVHIMYTSKTHEKNNKKERVPAICQYDRIFFAHNKLHMRDLFGIETILGYTEKQ